MLARVFDEVGPPELDFAWYLFVNGWRIDATREQQLIIKSISAKQRPRRPKD